jgi:hypothetical protein
MSIVKRHLAEHEERLALIEEICIDKGALVYDIDSDEVFFSADEDAYKTAYVTVLGERNDQGDCRTGVCRHKINS